MEDIVSILKIQKDFLSGKGSSPSAISDIENELGLRFAEDYKQSRGSLPPGSGAHDSGWPGSA